MDVIDLEEKRGQNGKNLFAKLSLLLSVISIALLTVSFLSISDTITPSSYAGPGINFIPFLIVLGFFMATIFTVLSYGQKERKSTIKMAALVLNLLLLVLLGGPIIFALVVDYTR